MRPPSPLAQIPKSKPHPTGTAKIKGIACANPRLAASAVDKVVLGPGVKLEAPASASKAIHSSGVMGFGLVYA
jgi:hypothetical protein